MLCGQHNKPLRVSINSCDVFFCPLREGLVRLTTQQLLPGRNSHPNRLASQSHSGRLGEFDQIKSGKLPPRIRQRLKTAPQKNSNKLTHTHTHTQHTPTELSPSTHAHVYTHSSERFLLSQSVTGEVMRKDLSHTASCYPAWDTLPVLDSGSTLASPSLQGWYLTYTFKRTVYPHTYPCKNSDLKQCHIVYSTCVDFGSFNNEAI